MNTKTNPAFSFKRNADIQALPEATLPERTGAKREPRVVVRKDHQVSCYLSEEEFNQLTAKLDGRPAAAVVRKLVLNYLSNG